MDMKILKSEKRLCTCCMEEHEVKIVEVREKTTFKGKKVEYTATYEYCDVADEYLSTEEMITSNDIAMKNAYCEYCAAYSRLTDLSEKNIMIV